MKFFFALLLLLSLSLPTFAQESLPAPYHADFYIPYVEDNTVRHTLDVYYPTTDSPVPTILLIHGGGFTQSDKQSMFGLAAVLVQEGFAVVAINYRFLPNHPYPAQIQDSFCALAWIQARTESYPFDAEKVVVVGYSAGAYLANMLGVIDDTSLYMEGCPHPTPARIAGVVSYASSNIFELGEQINPNGRTYIENYTGVDLAELSDAEILDIARPLTPLSWVDGSEPPFLIFHGDADTTVSSAGSQLLAEALEAVGVRTIFYIAPGVNHNIVGNIQVETGEGIVTDIDILVTFIRQVTSG